MDGHNPPQRSSGHTGNRNTVHNRSQAGAHFSGAGCQHYCQNSPPMRKLFSLGSILNLLDFYQPRKQNFPNNSENKICVLFLRFVHRYHLQRVIQWCLRCCCFIFLENGSLKIRSTREKQKFAKLWMLPMMSRESKWWAQCIVYHISQLGFFLGNWGVCV